MTYLLDTSIAIAIIRGMPAPQDRLVRTASDGAQLLLSTIVLYELWHGAARSDRPRESRTQVEKFLAGPFEQLAFDALDAEVAGTLRAALEREGRMIGPYDTLIAAQALRHRATLVTANTREFARVPSLSWEDWTEPAR